MDVKIKQAILNKERFINNYISIDYLNRETKKTETNYKISVLLSGGLRNYEYTSSWINKFLVEPLNADVFIHGWANQNGVSDNIEKINKFSNVKMYRVNDLNDPEFDHLKHGDDLVTRIYGQFFNIKMCNDLRKRYELENNIKYDIIIRARPDVFFFSEMSDDDLKYLYNNNSIGIPCEYFKLWSGKTTDVFAVGNRDMMDYYCDAYETVLESNFIPNEAESVVNNHLNNRRVNVYDIIPNFIIDYPYDLVTENMNKSPNINGLPYSITNRLLFQNDIKRN